MYNDEMYRIPSKDDEYYININKSDERNEFLNRVASSKMCPVCVDAITKVDSWFTDPISVIQTGDGEQHRDISKKKYLDT
jgi:hypothetical protein